MDIILQSIIKIFRACIALGYIPISWRTSRVVFVPKPGRADYTTVKAFRRISLMSFLLKTLERLVDRFIRDDTLISIRSMKISMHTWQVNQQIKALYNKEYALSVFLDIEGAFNNASTDSPLNVLRSKRYLTL